MNDVPDHWTDDDLQIELGRTIGRLLTTWPAGAVGETGRCRLSAGVLAEHDKAMVSLREIVTKLGVFGPQDARTN